MDSLYNRDVINFTSFNSVGIQTVIKMLGVSEEHFSVSEIGPFENNMDDGKIVDVISDLMEEFNADPKHSEKALHDMLVNNLDDSFLSEMENSNTIEDDFFGLENLMAESGDEDLSFVHATIEENMPSNIVNGEKLNVSFQDDVNITDIGSKLVDNTGKGIATRKCFVGVSNISTETLTHYYNVRVDSSYADKSVKRRPADDSDANRRKKRRNINEELEYEGVTEMTFTDKETTFSDTVVDKDSTILETSVEESCESQVAISYLPRNPPPGPPITIQSSVVADDDRNNADVQFVEAKQVTCMICNEVFKVRSKIIQHLCVNHFSNQILALHPFIRGGNCPLCVKAGKSKVIVLKDKNSHVRHIGQTHEMIFDIITPEFKESIDQFTKTSRRGPPINKYRVKEEKAEIIEQLEESNSSLQESPEDNYLKLLKDFKDNYEKTSNHATDSKIASQPHHDKFIPEVVQNKSAETSSGLASVNCHLCPEPVAFIYRSQFLTHLSCQHSSREILSLYPFEDRKPCELCYEIGRPDFLATSPLEYADHLGTFHEKVLDLIPPNYVDKIDAMPRSNENQSLDTSTVKPGMNSSFLDKDIEIMNDASKANMNDASKADSDCDTCHLTGTTSRAELMLHYASKHFQQQIFKVYPFHEGMPCRVCFEARQPKAFVAKSAFRHLKHVGVMHEKVLAYMSSFAKEMMERKFVIKKRENNLNPEAFGASMKNLINSTTNNTIAFSCKICSKTYVSEEELKVHRISHKETKNYCCKYCGMTCETAKQYKVHLLSHKDELSKSKLA